MNDNMVVSDCRNEALKKILQQKSIEISSDMIFGLGDGFDLSIVKGKLKHIEYLMLLGRNLECEKNLLNRLNIEYEDFISDESGEDLSDSMKKEIDNGNGIFVELDRFYLDYLPLRKAHFGMHAIAVMGYDDDEKQVKVYDSLAKNEFENIKYSDLNAAMHEELDTFKPNGNFISIKGKSANINLKYEDVKKYILQSSKNIINKYNDVLLIIKSKLNEFDSLKNQRVRDTLLNFQIDYICQLILEEEPSQSLYRKVYASFIHNLAASYNDKVMKDFSEQFKECGNKWTSLAIHCRDIDDNREKYNLFKREIENIILNEKLVVEEFIKYLEY